MKRIPFDEILTTFLHFQLTLFYYLDKISSKCLTGNSPPKENNFKTAATEKRFNKP